MIAKKVLLVVYPKLCLIIQAEGHTRLSESNNNFPCRATFCSCQRKVQMRVRWKTSWRPAVLPMD